MEGTFSGCTSFGLEILAAEVIGDIAYTVAYEHTEAIVNGESRVDSLRATQVYRREDGEWKVVRSPREARYRNACQMTGGYGRPNRCSN